MKRVITYLTFSLTFALIGCGKMDKYLEIDKSFSANPVLVVNGEVVAGEAPRLYISKTLPVNTPYHREKRYEAFGVREATVQCYINDILVETQTVTPPDKRDHPMGLYGGYGVECYYEGEVEPQAGDKVRFEVSSSGFRTVSVEVLLPIPPKFKIVKTEEGKAKRSIFFPYKYSDEEYPVMRMEVELQKAQDNPDIGVAVGFYGYVPLIGKMAEDYKDRVQKRALRIVENAIFSKDAIKLSQYLNKNISRITDAYRYPYLSTSKIVGDVYTLMLTGDINHVNWDKTDIYNVLVFNCMDPFYYEWATMRYGLTSLGVSDDDTIDLSEDADSPFAEPVLDITNVKGGRGMVLGYTREELTVIDKQRP